MKFRTLTLVFSLCALAGLPSRAVAHQNNSPAASQQSSATASSIPQIIQFSGQFTETSGGATPSGTVSITFTLYEDEQGGTALWSETQNVQVDAQGHYTALLGSTTSEGLPMNLFTTVQAHWLAVQPVGQGLAEQPRVLLVSAPYALKAGDAETIGGLPPSAFVRVAASSGESETIDGTSAGTSGGTTTVATTTQAGNGAAHAKPKTPSTTECGAFCDATTGYQIDGFTVLQVPGGLVSGNIALGYEALFTSATGTNNTASGAYALYYNSASNNTANGAYALDNNTTGGSNTASGANALYQNITGSNNAASGTSALVSNTTGNYNTASGAAALYSNTTANDNTASGFQALYSNTTGAGDSASGAIALQDNTTGNYNTANGYAALFSNATGSNNTASGDYALYHNTANDNTASGYNALFANTTGSDNTASGSGALFANTTGSNNAASGYEALYSNTAGTYNTASGIQALYTDTTGSYNMASGADALYRDTTGSNNAASGSQALYNDTTGGSNTASGFAALSSNTTGSQNTASGVLALQYNTTGTYNTALGYNAGTTQAGLSNATAIGALADVEENNALVLGSINGVNGATANTQVGIGTTTPAATLDVNGTANMRGLVTFAAGQTFPGAGTITGVTAGADLTGGGTTGSVTLNVDTTKVPTLGAASNVFTGSVTASSFTGSGAAVTSVNAALLDGLASSAFQPTGSYATLGANTFGATQTIGSGNLALPTTTASSSGVLTLGGQSFVHDFGGTSNAFLGASAGNFNGSNTGTNNTAAGSSALGGVTSGGNNTAMGYQALQGNTTGGNNTASGVAALQFNTTGANNIAIGYQAAFSVSGANSNNIEIGNAGTSADSGTIRIGTKGTQKKFFVAGVGGVTVGSAVPVMIDSATGQLGTVSSSRRFKEDIHDMGDASEGLMKLRPVTFRYKQAFDDGSKPIQYGLIAEEVAEVYPDLVARSADGQIETVKYQVLDPMLLNEVQRQHAEGQRQQALIQQQRDQLKTQEAQIKMQQAFASKQQNQIKAQQAQIAELVSNVKTIQASLRTRRGSGHARLASEKGTPAPATTDPILAADSSARGGN